MENALKTIILNFFFNLGKTSKLEELDILSIVEGE